MKASRRFITLIELMIVLAIIGAVAGVVGINVNKAMKQQRFQTEVMSVVKQLSLAQNLMLILNEDVKVKFDRHAKHPFWMELQHPIESGWQKELLRKPAPLKEITEIQLTSRQPQKDHARRDGFEIDFFSGGIVMTEGVLQLTSTLGEKRYIHLRGSPYPIAAVESHAPPPTAEKFHQQLAQDTVHEITPKWQQAKMQNKSRSMPNNPISVRPNLLKPNSP